MASVLAATAVEEDVVPIPESFRLNGNVYRPATMTVESNVYVTSRLRRSGIASDTRVDLNDRGQALSLARQYEDAIWAAFESGIMYEILGGLLVRDGTTWSRDHARETAEIIRTLEDGDEQRAIFDYASDVVIRFFRIAAGLNATSQRSSSSPSEEPRGAPDANTSIGSNVPSQVQAIDSAATRRATSPNSTASSESSPHGT